MRHREVTSNITKLLSRRVDIKKKKKQKKTGCMTPDYSFIFFFN